MAKHEGLAHDNPYAPDSQHEEVLRAHNEAQRFDVKDLPLVAHLTYDQIKGVVHSKLNPDINLSLDVHGARSEYHTDDKDLVYFLYTKGVYNPVPRIEVTAREIVVKLFDLETKNTIPNFVLYTHAVEPGLEMPALKAARDAVADFFAQSKPAQSPVEPAPAKKPSRERKPRAVVHTLGTFDQTHETFVVSGRNRGNVDLHINGLPACSVTETKDGTTTRVQLAYSESPDQRLEIVYDPATGKVLETTGQATGATTKELIRNFVDTVRVGVQGSPKGEPEPEQEARTEWEKKLTAILASDKDLYHWLPALRELKKEAKTGVASEKIRTALTQAVQIVEIINNFGPPEQDFRVRTREQFDELVTIRDLIAAETDPVYKLVQVIAIKALRGVRMSGSVQGISFPLDWEPSYETFKLAEPIIPVEPARPAAPDLSGLSPTEVQLNAVLNQPETTIGDAAATGADLTAVNLALETFVSTNEHSSTMSADALFGAALARDLAVQLAPEAGESPEKRRENLQTLHDAVETNRDSLPTGLPDLFLATIDAELNALPTVAVEPPAVVLGPEKPKFKVINRGGPFHATFEFQPDKNPKRGILTWQTPRGELRYTGSVNDYLEPDSAVPARLELNDQAWVGTFRDGALLFGEQFSNDELVVSGYFERQPIVSDTEIRLPVPKPPAVFLGHDGYWYSIDISNKEKPISLRRYQNVEDARIGRNVLLEQEGKNFGLDMMAGAKSPENIEQREFLAADFLSLLGEGKLSALFTATETDPTRLLEFFHNIFDDLGNDRQTLVKLQTVGFDDRQDFIDWWRSSASETAATALQFFVLQGLERTAAAAQAKQPSAKTTFKEKVFGFFKKITPSVAAGGSAGLVAGSAAAMAGQGPLVTALVAIFSAIQGSRQVREHQAAPTPMAETGRVERRERWDLAVDAQTQFYQENRNNGPELVAAIIAGTVNGARDKNITAYTQHTRASEAQTAALRELATHTIKDSSGEFTPEASGRLTDYLVAALDYRTDVLRNQLLDPVRAESIGQKLSLVQELKQALGRGQIMNLWAGEKDATKRWLGRIVETVAGTAAGLAMSTVGGMAFSAKVLARFGLGAVTGSLRSYHQEGARQTDKERTEKHTELLHELVILRTEWRTNPNRAVILDKHKSREGQDMYNILYKLKDWVSYAKEHPEAQLFAGGELLFIQATELIREIETESKLISFVKRIDAHNKMFSYESPLEKAVAAQQGFSKRALTALKQGFAKGALYNVYGGALDGLRAIFHTQTTVESSTEPAADPAIRRGEDDQLGFDRRSIETTHPVLSRELEPVSAIPRQQIEESLPIEPTPSVPENLPVEAEIPESEVVPEIVPEVIPEFVNTDFWAGFKTDHDLSDDTVEHFQALYNEFSTSLDKDELNQLIETSSQGQGQGVEQPLLRELKVLHEALRDPAQPAEITPDLFKLYEMIGYKPTTNQVPEWGDVQRFFAREAHRGAIRAGHITPDGLYQKVVMFKPGAIQRQVIGLDNGKLVPTYDQSPQTPRLQRDLDYPTPKAELRSGSRTGEVQRFINELTTGAYKRNLVLEPDVNAPALNPQTTIVHVESAGDHVVAHYSDDTIRPYDVSEDGVNFWHLFPHRGNSEVGTASVVGERGGTTVTARGAESVVSEVAPQPTVRTAEVKLPGNVRATVAVGKNGLAELKFFGKMTVRADEARQLLMGDPHYPARLSEDNHAKFDEQANKLALGLQAYDALRASRQGNTAAADALRDTLAGAIRRMAETAHTPVKDLVDPTVAQRLGLG